MSSGASHRAPSIPWKPQSGGCGMAAMPMSVRSAVPAGEMNILDCKLRVIESVLSGTSD